MKSNIHNLPDVSIIILCYQAGRRIEPFVANTISALKKNNITDYELILVGNYWPNIPDETPAVVAEIASIDPNIKYVVQEKKGMMGWDMKSGLVLATGNYLVVIDGDGQMPIEDLIKVYKKIKSDNLDLVKTYRIKRGDNLWRKVVSFFYNNIFLILFPGAPSHDVNSKPKIFTRAVYERLNLQSDDWFIDAEIMIQARRLHLRTAEIPTYFRGLEGRKSFIKPAAILEFIKNLMIYRWREFKESKKDTERKI